MAPLSRGKRGSRGGSSFASRGAPRSRGPVHGRGRGNSTTKNSSRNVFYPTRVEEHVEEDANLSDGSQKSSLDKQDSSSANRISSNESSEDEEPNVTSYSTLLQSLSANVQRGPPQRKKRKMDIEDRTEPSYSEIQGATFEDQDGFETTDLDAVEGQPDLEDAALFDEIEEVSKEDPFTTHVADPDESELAVYIKHMNSARLRTIRGELPSGLSYSMTIPSESTANLRLFSSRPQTTQELQIKQKLQIPASKLLPNLNDTSKDLACPIFNYKDLLFVERTTKNAGTLRMLGCLHLLNHVFKTRDRVIRNNARLAKDTIEADLELRDQGFTRPKVLVLLPTRESCVKWVETIVSLCEPEQQENRKRFQDSYTQAEDNLSEDKPDDFRELFGGNDDDMFRLGLKFTRKTIKYFSQFYNSDIIFASPLGLRMAIGVENDKKQDHDFLSSIEIMIVDQADALSMQNWEHVDFIFDHLNLQPKEAHGCDFSRVRNWYLDGHSRYLRQTLLFSAFNFPALNRLYLHQILNVAGKVKLAGHYDGAMLGLSSSVRQTFSRFEGVTPVSEPDDRFAYFTAAIVPALVKHSAQASASGQGVLIYLPSYADFVRVRNYLATSSTTQNISFGSISEYTSVRDVARARSHFFTGRHSVLLYTERAHHFRRYHLRGVKRIFMYVLPENPVFYKEIVGGFLGASMREGKLNPEGAGVRSMFSKLDVLKLERIVGSRRVISMIKESTGDTFDFI